MKARARSWPREIGGAWALLRILHVVPSLDDKWGGLQKATLLIAAAEQRAGAEVTILSTMAADETYHSVEALASGVEVVKKPVNLRSFRTSAGLLWWLHNYGRRYDVVHVHSIWNFPAAAAMVSAAIQGVPLVCSPHGSLDHYDVKKHAVAKRVLGKLFVGPALRRARALIFTSKRESELAETYGARPARVVLPLPVEEAPAGCGDVAKRQHSLPPNKQLLLFAGRIDPKKGLRQLVSTLPSVPDDIHLVIVGSGAPDFEAVVQGDVDRLGVSSRVTFTGWLTGRETADVMAACDAFVLLSDNENYGIAVIEAIRAGLPVIITKQVYIAEELVNAGVAVTTAQDPALAAEVISRLMSDSGTREEIARRGVQFIANRTIGALGRDYISQKAALIGGC